MYSRLCSLLGAAGFTAALLIPSLAHAGLDACGDIHVEAEAECELQTSGGCQTTCEELDFEAACSADLYAECQGECSAEVEVDCQADCQADCTGSCEVEPGSYECGANCYASCEGTCEAECQAGDNQAECRASCEATCSGSCDASCEGTPPEATCDAKCEASCEGSCQGEANAQCQIDCQAGGYVDCKADLQIKCETQCEEFDGALVCDGQYVDHGGNLEECVAALEAALNIEVEGYADGECGDGSCEGEAGGSISCGSTVAPIDGYDRKTAVLAGLLVLGLWGAGRRRRR